MNTVVIAGVGQFIDFETGEVTNMALLRLPNGKTVEAKVSEQEAQEMINAFVETGAMPGPAPQPWQQAQQAVEKAATETIGALMETERDTVVFGGDVPAPPGELVMPAPQASPPPKRRHRLVGKDDAGNPIVEYDGVRPEEVVGGGDGGDEDGVRQL